MKTRILLATFFCILIYAVGQAFYFPIHIGVQEAERLVGKKWYKLNASEKHIGFLLNEVRRNQQGGFEFNTTLQLSTLPGQMVSFFDRLEFSGLPPYELLEAIHQEHGTSSSKDISITLLNGDYIAYINNLKEQKKIPFANTQPPFTLEDYLAFENWLIIENPLAGDTKLVRRLDMDSLAINKTRFQLISHKNNEYSVRDDDSGNTISLSFDKNLILSSINITNALTITRANEAAALNALDNMLTPDYSIPVDKKIIDKERIKRLVLAISGYDAPEKSWTNLYTRGLTNTLTIEQNPIDPRGSISEPNDSIRSENTYREIKNLAQSITKGAITPQEQILRINQFVNNYLTYSLNKKPKTIIQLLTDRTGQCADYADLFTELARSLEIPAKTVFGLAYYDSETPEFRFHAWNEVSIGGERMTVEPTWGQFPADATHIAFSQSWSALSILAGQPNVKFSIKTIEYLDS